MGTAQQPYWNPVTDQGGNGSFMELLTGSELEGQGKFRIDQSGNITAAPIVSYFPSADTSGAKDTAAIQNMLNLGVDVQLGPGDYYIQGNYQTDPATGRSCGIAMPVLLPQNLAGWHDATILHHVGGNAAISMHRPNSSAFGTTTAWRAPALRGFVIDGSNASAGAVGLDWGDGWHYDIDLTIANYSAANCIGLWAVNSIFYTEKCTVRLLLDGNTTAAVFDVNGTGQQSHEYSRFDLFVRAKTGQQGVVIANGAYLGGCILNMYGNMIAMNGGSNPNNLAWLTITGADSHNNYSYILGATITFKVEGNNDNQYASPVYPYGIYIGSANNGIRKCGGRIYHDLVNSILNGAEFSFRGLISGDNALATGWPSVAFPGFGTAWTNNGPDATVVAGGGGTSGIQISGNPTGLTGPAPFFIPAGGLIKVTGSGAAPTFNVLPASESGF